MIPEDQVQQPHELAHVWLPDLGIRPDMIIKVGF